MAKYLSTLSTFVSYWANFYCCKWPSGYTWIKSSVIDVAKFVVSDINNFLPVGQSSKMFIKSNNVTSVALYLCAETKTNVDTFKSLFRDDFTRASV